jgi:DNA-directed RNA polymerase subunit RPC12/RpoP
MTDYTKLVKALRERAQRENEWYEHGGDIIKAAADAIEALDAKADYWMGQAQEEYEKRLRQMPKRGEWIEDRTEIVCSKCHARFSDEIIFMNRNMENEALKYCPNCGAKMEVQE